MAKRYKKKRKYRSRPRTRYYSSRPKNTKPKISKEEQKQIDDARKKLENAKAMKEIYKTYQYKKDWKYLEKHLQQWSGDPYDFVNNYYKSPDWKYYKPASKHNKLVDLINSRKYRIKNDSYVERIVAIAKEIIVVLSQILIMVYLGCFAFWNIHHSKESKDLDLDEESHTFNVDKFMNMIDINMDQSPFIYEFVKSMYVGLAKIPRDALYYVFCQLNQIFEKLYYGADGGPLWADVKTYGKTPSHIRAVIQLIIAGLLPIGMYFVGTVLACVFMFGYLHLGYIKTTINLIKNGFFEYQDYWFIKHNFTAMFLWLTVGALAHFILIPAVIGGFFTVGYLIKMFQNIGLVNNVFKNITKSYLNVVLLLLITGVILIKKYGLYFPDKMPINVKTKGLIPAIIAIPFIIIPLFYIYKAIFGTTVPAAPATGTGATAAPAATPAAAPAAAATK
jgi:hypothetical protein